MQSRNQRDFHWKCQLQKSEHVWVASVASRVLAAHSVIHSDKPMALGRSTLPSKTVSNPSWHKRNAARGHSPDNVTLVGANWCTSHGCVSIAQQGMSTAGVLHQHVALVFLHRAAQCVKDLLRANAIPCRRTIRKYLQSGILIRIKERLMTIHHVRTTWHGGYQSNRATGNRP